jgi:hypothetical protein
MRNVFEKVSKNLIGGEEQRTAGWALDSPLYGPWILLYLYPFSMGTDGDHKKEEEANGRRTEKVDAGKVSF